MKNKTIFEEAVILDKPLTKVDDLILNLKSHLDYIYELSVDELLDYFDYVSEKLKNKETNKDNTLKVFANFIRKDNLKEILNFSLRGNYQVLDKFVDLNKTDYIYSCQPRGLIVHWLAGNVPLLGLYSIIQSMLTKNVSLVKAPSQGYEELISILQEISNFNFGNIQGKELLKTICVVLIDREDKITQNKISEKADVRMAWGGKEAIESITSLKKKLFSEDIVFGPKYSYGIIDKESLKDYKKIAQRLSFDICTFDQYACSSPHTIFIENGGEISALKFAEELSKSLDFVSKKMVPKGMTEPKKRMDILTIRTKYSMIGKVFTTEEGLAEPCFSRVIFIKPISNLLELEGLNSTKIQTLGCALGANKKELIRKLTKRGIDRCPKFGDMTLFESPWDGIFPVDRMVRWVKLYK